MIFLNTNVVVELLRNKKPKLRERYNAARGAGALQAISSVVFFELRFGAENSNGIEQNLRALLAFLDDAMPIVAFDEAAAEAAGSIRAHLRRSGAIIGPSDILIAAQARSMGAPLVNAKTSEFERAPGLTVLDWTASHQGL